MLVATFTPVKTRLDVMAAHWMGQPVPGAVPAVADDAELADTLPDAAADEPPPAPAAAYDPRNDPEFEAWIEERIRAMLAERYKSSR